MALQCFQTCNINRKPIRHKPCSQNYSHQQVQAVCKVSAFFFFLITTFGRMNRPSFKRTKLINSCISDFYCIPNFIFTSSFTERPERGRIPFYFIKFNKPFGLHLLNIYLFMGYRGTILQHQGCLRNILVEKIITGFWSESLPSPLSRYSLQHGSVQVK